MSLLFVFLGGGVGSLLRFGLSLAAQQVQRPNAAWPWATFACNLLGCLAIGALAGWFGRQDSPSPLLARLLMTGLIGGFTTFSAFGLETLTLLQRGQGGIALGYALASVLGGVALAAAGWASVQGRS